MNCRNEEDENGGDKFHWLILSDDQNIPNGKSVGTFHPNHHG